MNDLLRPLVVLPGVKGAALLTPDGVLVASEFYGIDGEALAALASQLLRQADEAAGPIGCPSFRRLTLRAYYGTLCFARLEEVVLLVATEGGRAPRSLWDEIEKAAAALPRLGEENRGHAPEVRVPSVG